VGPGNAGRFISFFNKKIINKFIFGMEKKRLALLLF
jgi:hypothetical protein